LDFAGEKVEVCPETLILRDVTLLILCCIREAKKESVVLRLICLGRLPGFGCVGEFPMESLADNFTDIRMAGFS
jgi:hypothetical protein